MFLVYVQVMILSCSLVRSTERRYNALRFEPDSHPDHWSYVQWSPVNISSATSHLSLCTWIRRRHRALEPMVLSYTKADTEDFEMILGDDERYNYVTGTRLHLGTSYNVSNGKWFHVCLTWSTRTQRSNVYVNGGVIRSQNTHGGELSSGGTVCLGNTASSLKESRYAFRGDLFKLNIFNRVLSHSEIRRMAFDMCSSEEESFNSSRILRWEDVISKERTGSVHEISTGCNVAQAEQVIRTRQKLRFVEEKLRKAEKVLLETQYNLTFYRELAAANQTEDGGKCWSRKLEVVT